MAAAVFNIVFFIILTRRLSTADYGTWVMIWRYIGYFLIPSVIYATWVTRDVSRGKNTSITGVVTSLFFGVASVPFYVLVMIFLSSNLHQPLVPLLISSSCFFLDYLNSALVSVSAAHAPQIAGYAGFAYDSGQLIFGVLFIIFLGLGLTGAVIAALAGRIMMNSVSITMNRSVLRKSSLQLHQITAWIKASWLPLFGSFGAYLGTFDALIVSFIYRSQIPIAYYGICVSIASMVTFAGVAASPLYPKIICKKNLEDVKEAIWITSLLSLPIIFLIIIYSKQLCAILNPAYTFVAPALAIMVFGAYFQLMQGLATTAYYGLEPCDEKTLEPKQLLRSSLFRGYQITLLFNMVYLLLLYALSSLSVSYLSFVIIWVSVLASLYIVSLSAFIILIKRRFSMTFPVTSMLRDLLIFAVAAVPAAILSILIPVPVTSNLYIAFYHLIPTGLLSLAVYLCFLYLIERRFRTTVRDIIKKVRPTAVRNAC